jgi:ribosomal protein S20
MADNSTIEIKGLDERIKQFGEASTKNPEMRRRINEVIRAMMKEVRKKLQGDAQSGLQMKSDQRKAYKAIKMAVYRKIFGGNVSILSPRRAGTLRLYEPPRHPSRRGGNRMKRPKDGRTETMMSYTGGDRWIILQWLNNGTKGRYALSGRNGSAREDYDSFILRTGGRGWRGSITGRNWFGPRSAQELRNAAANIDAMIDDIVAGVLY